MAFLKSQDIFVSPQQTLFDHIERMIAVGWQVLGSGNTSTYENKGQTLGLTGTGSGGGYHLFTSSTGMNTVVTNTGASWIRLRSPEDAPHVREYLIQRNFYSGGTNTQWRIELSRNGIGFNSGASATTRPTAADKVAIGQKQPVQGNESDDFTNMFPTGEGVFYSVVGDASENYDFLLCSWGPTLLEFMVLLPGLDTVWGQGYVSTPFTGNQDGLHSSTPTDVDEDPYIYLFQRCDPTDSRTLYDGTKEFKSGYVSGTIQESATSNSESGVFTSFKYGQGADHEGTVKAALTFPAMYFSLLSYAPSDVAPPGFPMYSSPPVIGPYPIGSIPIFSASGTGRNFCKGVYAGNMLKVSGRTDQAAGAFPLQPVTGGEWYMNFAGLLIVWPRLLGRIC